jgi:hypothetical protein
MKHALQMGLGALLYIPCFIKSGSGIRKVMGDVRFIDTVWRSRIPGEGNLTIKGS